MQRGSPLGRSLLGQCALAAGDVGGAEAHLRASLAALAAMGALLDAARAGLVLAEALAARTGPAGIPAEARALLAGAQAQFATSGAVLDLARAEQVATVWGTR